MELFDTVCAEPTIDRQAQKDGQKQLTLDMVSEWLNRTGWHNNRVTFFSGVELYADQSLMYQKVLKPILSLRTTGSVAVERVAKPLKQKVLEKHRNRYSPECAEMLLRVGLNLNFLKGQRGQLKVLAEQLCA